MTKTTAASKVRFAMTKALSPRTVALLPEIAAMVLAVVIGATVWLILEYQAEVAAVRHTLEIQQRLSQLLSTVQEAETGNRGFLLTGDESYLEGYDTAVGELEGKFNNLKTLTADNPALQRALNSLRPIVQSRFDLLQEGIALRRQGGLSAAEQFIKTNSGRDVMALVRSGIAQLQEAEILSRRERSARAEKLIRAGTAGAAIGIALVFLSVMGWIWNQRRDARRITAEIAERRQAEAQIRQMQKLEAVGQLTGGIAHDFNNMLAVVLSGLSLIKRRLAAGDTNVLELADAAIDGANRAATLTSRLMSFARQQPLEPRQ
ncbi:MAG: CHASE3 domain-containing protein, partial [Methylocella sp.]